MGAVEAACGEGSGDDFAGEHFAEGGDVVGGAGRDFADGGDAAQEFVERLEIGAQFGMEFGEARGAQQFAGGVVVALLQRAAEFEGGLALAGAGGLRHGQERVGDFGHGADHDYRVLRQAPLDDRGDAVDGFGVFDGSAAELHDDHRRDFLERVFTGKCRGSELRGARAGRRRDGGATFKAPRLFISRIPCLGSLWLLGVRR